MSWRGSMTCYITNQTGNKIALVAQHALGNTIDPLAFIVLNQGGSISFPITVGSGHNDLWSIWFMDTTGTFWYEDNKQCNVEEEDFKSGKPVHINLGPKSLSVDTPVSSPCDATYSSKH